MRIKCFKKVAYYINTCLIVFLLISFTTGCSLLRKDKQSIVEKKQAKAQQAAVEEYENARKAHYKHQAAETQQMMKQSKKQSKKLNRPKKRKNWFGRKCS